MGGYNTCMDLITAGVPALIWPFDGDREQPLRADRLADRGLVSVLSSQDLAPSRLAERIQAMWEKADKTAARIDLKGAARTARYIEAQALPASNRAEGG